MTGTITGFAIFSTILFLYLISNTVGRSQYFSNGITAEERSLFSSTLLCIDNPTATLIITDLEVRDRTADGSAVVFGYTVFGWQVVKVDFWGVEKEGFDSCKATWEPLGGADG
jgi:hypothetical protein